MVYVSYDMWINLADDPRARIAEQHLYIGGLKKQHYRLRTRLLLFCFSKLIGGF
jgi:hypothetical protein